MKEIVGQVRTIHPETIKEIDEKYALVLLEIARDLRSGKIEHNKFSMYGLNSITLDESRKVIPCCRTPCCILGYVRIYVGDNKALDEQWKGNCKSERLFRLFSGINPSDPYLAARAIEAYVYDYAEHPWSTAAWAKF